MIKRHTHSNTRWSIGYTEAAIADNILTEVDDWIEDDDAEAHVERSEAQKRRMW